MRAPDGTEPHPDFCPTRFTKSLEVAHFMNSYAAGLFLELASMAKAQAQSQPLSAFSFIGAYAIAMLLALGFCLGSNSRSAAEVASYHIPTLPWTISVSHSVKPAWVAPGSPVFLTVLITVSSGANCSPQPGRPRKQMPN